MIRKIHGIEYELTRKNVKNINLRVTRGKIKVSAGNGIPASYIDAFVASKAEFIKKAAERAESRIPVPVPNITDNEALMYFTDITRRIYPRFSRFGFPFPSIKVRLMKSQWGNCRRANGLITYNKYLCSLPDRLAEFVAAHELSHMVISGHSAEFYAILDEAMPDHRARRAELSQYSIK